MSSSNRATLTLAPVSRPLDLADLSTAREPLARFETEKPAPAKASLPDFPARKVRERVTHVSMRMPNSLLDEVEALCTERGIDRTTLILHFVRHGLNTVIRA